MNAGHDAGRCEAEIHGPCGGVAVWAWTFGCTVGEHLSRVLVCEDCHQYGTNRSLPGGQIRTIPGCGECAADAQVIEVERITPELVG
jgi:hypothetical protein